MELKDPFGILYCKILAKFVQPTLPQESTGQFCVLTGAESEVCRRF